MRADCRGLPDLFSSFCGLERLSFSSPVFSSLECLSKSRPSPKSLFCPEMSVHQAPHARLLLLLPLPLSFSVAVRAGTCRCPLCLDVCPLRAISLPFCLRRISVLEHNAKLFLFFFFFSRLLLLLLCAPISIGSLELLSAVVATPDSFLSDRVLARDFLWRVKWMPSSCEVSSSLHQGKKTDALDHTPLCPDSRKN